MIKHYTYTVRIDYKFRCWSITHLIYLARLRVIEHKVAAVLGDNVSASRWMISRPRGLSYLAPCCILTTRSGYVRVFDFLDSLEQCIYL